MSEADVAPAPARADTWRDLLAPPHLVAVAVMCAGVLLYAMNLFFTSALMPTIVGDVGGQAYYAWVTTAFVMVAIVASLLVSPLQQWQGTAVAYVIAFGTFAVGAAASALAPDMGWLVASRAVQGLGGGLLVGLGYAVIRMALPRRHWARGMSAVSAMWGVGLLFGPALGGVFATFDLWRAAYWGLAVAGIVLALAALRSFAGVRSAGQRVPLPLLPLFPLMGAIVLISVSAIVPVGWLTLGLLAGGVALLALFLRVERAAEHTLLPALAYRPGNRLKWVYLTVAALSAGVTLENFIPLYAQQMAGLAPFVNGLLAASISVGWVTSQFFFVTLSPRGARRVIRLGPVLMTAGLVLYAVLQLRGAGAGVAVGWFVVLALSGCGVGMSWPSLGVAAMGSSSDSVQGGKAAAAISTTQLISYSLASALVGLLMALGHGSPALAARLAIGGLACATALGILSARAATRADAVDAGPRIG